MSTFNTAIGVFFGIFAEFFGSSGNIQIKYSHKLEEKKSHTSQTPLFKRTRFRIAIILYAFNGICNLVSCIFASLNVLAPTASFTIVLNAALAHFYFGEKLTKLGYFASFLIMVGSTISVIYGKSESKTSFQLQELTQLVMRGGSIFFAIAHWFIISCCILIGKALSKQYELEQRIIFNTNGSANGYDTISQSTVDNDDVMERIRATTNKFCKGGSSQYAIRAFCYSFATGSIASWVQFFGKAVGVLISESVIGDEQFNKMGSWLFMIFALWFIYWMMILISEMMRLFDAVLIVPLYETFIIFNMVLLDAMYFGRDDPVEDNNVTAKVYFWLGILICVIGMFVLTVAQRDNFSMDSAEEQYQIESVDVEKDIESYDENDGKFLFEDEMQSEEVPLIAQKKRSMRYTDYNSTGHTRKYELYDTV